MLERRGTTGTASDAIVNQEVPLPCTGPLGVADDGLPDKFPRIFGLSRRFLPI